LNIDVFLFENYIGTTRAARCEGILCCRCREQRSKDGFVVEEVKNLRELVYCKELEGVIRSYMELKANTMLVTYRSKL
jgi:hypothetical protein